MTIPEAQQKLLDELSLFQDWTERYEYIISLGKQLEFMPKEAKTDDKLIQGCQSQVWLDASTENGIVTFLADSDSLITKGMIALFVQILTNRTPNEILASDMSFIDQTGLKEHLAPTRANALNIMASEMKKHALRFSQQ